MPPIRILNLFTIMDRGGAETMVMNYYRHIDRSKVQFDFMVHRQARGAYDDEIESLGGKIYRMPAIRPWTAAQYRKTIRAFYAQHPEYRIIHSHMSELGYYDFIEAERAKVPVRICHAHNRPYGLDLKSPVRWYYKTMMMPHITHMFMCGEESGEWLFGKKNKDSFIQLNNAIDAKQYQYNDETRQHIRNQLGLSDELVIGHIGRFNPQKNHPFIIDIFAAVQKQYPNSVLLLIGDDSCENGDDIHRKVKSLGLDNHVKFLGVRSDVPDLLQAMDVFLFPSLFEGFGIAALEAQAAGLPAIVSERIPPECYLTNFLQTCHLNDSLETWTKRIIKSTLISRRDTYSEIAAAGFDITENANWLQNFYLEQWKAINTSCQH